MVQTQVLSSGNFAMEYGQQSVEIETIPVKEGNVPMIGEDEWGSANSPLIVIHTCVHLLSINASL